VFSGFFLRLLSGYILAESVHTHTHVHSTHVHYSHHLCTNKPTTTLRSEDHVLVALRVRGRHLKPVQTKTVHRMLHSTHPSATPALRSQGIERWRADSPLRVLPLSHWLVRSGFYLNRSTYERGYMGEKFGCALGTPCGPCSPKPDGRHVHGPFIQRQLETTLLRKAKHGSAQVEYETHRAFSPRQLSSLHQLSSFLPIPISSDAHRRPYPRPRPWRGDQSDAQHRGCAPRRAPPLLLASLRRRRRKITAGLRSAASFPSQSNSEASLALRVGYSRDTFGGFWC
jgi:hypothetical protein